MKLSFKKVALTALTAAELGLVAATPSPASSSIAVAGGAVPTSTTYTSVRSADGNTLLDGFGTHTWSGSFTGTSVINVHLVIHPNGQLTYQAFLTFTGSTPCGAGTVELASAGSGPVPGPIVGHLGTIDQAAGSVPIHADLDVVLFLTPGGAAGTYSGDVRCG